jgi:TonB family protein
MLSTEGSVTAEFIVNEQGKPTAIQILDASHPQLAAAAIDAVSNWRYKPATRNGSPYPCGSGLQ